MYTKEELAKIAEISLGRLNKFKWYFEHTAVKTKIITPSGKLRMVRRYNVLNKDLEMLIKMAKKDKARESVSSLPKIPGEKKMGAWNNRLRL